MPGLDSIEQAIRSALGKGNAGDPAFRERVYRSAQAALERAVLANQSIPADAVARRRKHFLETIARIETDFRPAVAPAAPAPSIDPPRPQRAEPAPRPPSIGIGETRIAPRPMRHPQRAEPAFGDEDAAAPEPPQPERRMRDDRQDRSVKRRPFPWGTVVGLTSFVVIAGLAYWTAVEFGFVGGSAGRTEAPRPAQNGAGSTEAPARPGNNDPLAGWMPVFNPSDPTTVAASPGARAEVVTQDGRQVLRISSGAGGAVLRFDIGAGVLERLAGKRAVFDVVAVASGGVAQMSVTCAMGELENCGRNRYTVGVEQSEYLFEVDVPKGAGRSAGAIEIVAGVADESKSIDIVEIRVSTADATQQ